ncbi:MAG: hypothetical protein K0S55_1454 [Clostridia bacterium]|nr:hypothetical protein [Clostridia bacterium]
MLCEVPDNFIVHSDFLSGCGNDEFISGFKDFRNIISMIYSDISEKPENFGFVTKNRSTGEIKMSDQYFECIYGLFMKLVLSSNIIDNIFNVDVEWFIKANSQYPKLSYIEMLFDRLTECGFYLEGYNSSEKLKNIKQLEVSYPDNPYVIYFIKEFMSFPHPHKTWKLWITSNHESMFLNYRLFTKAKKEILDITDFCTYNCLDDKKQEAIKEFDSLMNQSNLGKANRYPEGCKIYMDFDGSAYIHISISYKIINKKNNLNYIQKLPLRVRIAFTNDDGSCCFCGGEGNPCGMRRIYMIDGTEYLKCAHKSFKFYDFSMDSVPYYVELAKMLK